MPFKSKKQRKWMHANEPEMAKRWEKEYQKGGKAKGPSHKNGGIPIEVEGGEIVINKSENQAAQKHEERLLALNKNPDDYEIIKKDSKFNYEYGKKIQVFDARNRTKRRK